MHKNCKEIWELFKAWGRQKFLLLPKPVRKFSHGIFGEEIFQFRLPDSKFDIALKSFEDELYVKFTMKTPSEIYSFVMELNQVRWVLLNIADLVIAESNFEGAREIQLTSKSKFQFVKHDAVASGKYGMRALSKKYHYIDLSREDLILFQGQLGFLSEEPSSTDN